MNVLFLCTGNSARSILGEVIFNELFSKYGIAYSAGSNPVGKVNPMALIVLERHGHYIGALKSQNVNEFTGDSAPVIDMVISVCDNAMRDCPVWPGKGTPKHLHLSLPDPVAIDNEAEKLRAFESTYQVLKEKIEVWFSDPSQ